VEFQGLGDGKVLWTSGSVKNGDAAKEVNLELKGVKSLQLVVLDQGDYGWDHSDWADARFEYDGQPPKAVEDILEFEVNSDIVPFASTPPMGWNSWDSFGAAVTEEQVRANADYMAEHLAKHGWKYVVVDIQWYEPEARGHNYRPDAVLTMDAYGRLLPAVNRFPSSADGKGFKPLADYMHGKGLKFGIHIMRGIPRQAADKDLPIPGTEFRAAAVADKNNACSWNPDMYGVDMSKEGGQAYYNSIFALYAEWGVDYVKVDDISSPYHADEISGVRKAIDKTGRAIVLSLSPGPAPVESVPHLMQNANLWRISGDFWDNWPALEAQFHLCRRWAPYIRPGHWPDADMLPLGRLGGPGARTCGLTKDEQVALMTLWAIFRSPLMFGGDLPGNDDFTLSLITNDEVLAVNRNSTANRPLFTRNDLIAWIADVPGSGDKYVAMFNIGKGEGPAEIGVLFEDLGLKQKCGVRDLWTHKDLGEFEKQFAQKIPRHGGGLYRISPR
jgi:hypothetical protein